MKIATSPKQIFNSRYQSIEEKCSNDAKAINLTTNNNPKISQSNINHDETSTISNYFNEKEKIENIEKIEKNEKINSTNLSIKKGQLDINDNNPKINQFINKEENTQINPSLDDNNNGIIESDLINNELNHIFNDKKNLQDSASNFELNSNELEENKRFKKQSIDPIKLENNQSRFRYSKPVKGGHSKHLPNATTKCEVLSKLKKEFNKPSSKQEKYQNNYSNKAKLIKLSRSPPNVNSNLIECENKKEDIKKNLDNIKKISISKENLKKIIKSRSKSPSIPKDFQAKKNYLNQRRRSSNSPTLSKKSPNLNFQAQKNIKIKLDIKPTKQDIDKTNKSNLTNRNKGYYGGTSARSFKNLKTANNKDPNKKSFKKKSIVKEVKCELQQTIKEDKNRLIDNTFLDNKVINDIKIDLEDIVSELNERKGIIIEIESKLSKMRRTREDRKRDKNL